MAAGAHFGCPKFTFECISGHFRSIRNFFWKFLTKWLQSTILDVRNSLSIAFLAILDQYGTFFGNFLQNGCCRQILDVWNSLSIAILAISDRNRIFFSGGHFGCPKITFDCISAHFWSIGHFVCPKFTFDGISDHFRSIRILIIFFNFWQNGRWWPFWISENHLRSHFWPFQIDTKLLFFLIFWQNGCRRPFWMGRQCQLSNSSEIFGGIMHVSSLKNVV